MSAREPGDPDSAALWPAQPTRVELLEAFLAAYDADAGSYEADDKTRVLRSTHATRQAVLKAREAIK